MVRVPWLPILSTFTIFGVIYASEAMVRPPVRKDRIVITYWEKWTNFEADAMRDVVNKFNNSQDKIFVNYLSVSGIATKTMLATIGNMPPDLAGLYGPNVAEYAYNNAVIPLDDIAAEAGIKKDDYINGFWDICNYRGKLWAVPTTPASVALHFNTRLMSEAGWDATRPPETIEQLDAMVDKVTKIGPDGKIKISGFLPQEPGWWNWCWPYYFGGKLWDGESKLTTDSEECVKAYTWVGSFAKRFGLSNVQTFRAGHDNFDSPQNAFMDEIVVSELQGVWMANFIEKYNKEIKWGAVPFPYPEARPDLKNSSILDLDVIVIPRGAKHIKEAAVFLKFLEKQENMEMLCLLQKKASPLKKVSAEFYAKHPNPYIKLFRDISETPASFASPKIPIWSEYSDELNKAMDDINTGTDVRTALRRVKERIQPHLDHVLALQKIREASGK